MQTRVWEKALESCSDRQRAGHYLDQLRSAGAAPALRKATLEQARTLVALLSGSQALSELLIVHPEWLSMLLDLERLRHPRQEQGLDRELTGLLKPLLRTRDHAGAFANLRQFKQREMLRIAARDLARFGQTVEIIQELSSVADICLNEVFQLCWRQLEERFGAPYYQDADGRWQPTKFCVLGLGKLGGQELNYSSDVDVLFVYSEEGHVFKEPPRLSQPAGKGLSNHRFFKRLSEAFIAEVGRFTPDGMLYRVDLRLRPEGDMGPLARSLSSYENYYAQWGQTWERMMLIKARSVAGDKALGTEFLEMIHAFRYPRSLGERILREIAEMKRRIELEVVKPGEMDRNVKLGKGGIREIEFFAQTLQLLRGGRFPFLQTPQTLPALQKLAQYDLLKSADLESLTGAYNFLRDIEHRLQMENNLQTHTIPTERKARERLARLMGFGTINEFETARKKHTANVRKIYESLLNLETPREKGSLPRDFVGAETEWKKLLAECAFKDVDKSLRLVREFIEGPGYVHVSPRTSDLACELLPQFLALCPRKDRLSKIQSWESKILSDPDRVLTRLDSFVTAYGARALLYETWASNPSLFELLLLLFDRSEFLAETAIRTPDLVDELVLSGRIRRRKTSDEILRDLRHGLGDEDQKLWVRRYHEAELLRIGLRDILGLADFEQSLTELSALADACLQYVLEAVLRKNRIKNNPVVIIGLGKLGGAELNYGSDLDLIFVTGSKQQHLHPLQRVAVEVMEVLSSQTERGIAFVTDARLRPDGEKGLLVNSLDAYEEYYRNRALLWEIQSLTRTRPIAGNLEVGQQFQKVVAELTNFKEPSLPLAAYSPDWRRQIGKMRLRIERERTPPGKERLAIKTGAGGLMDAEFIAQAGCLAEGWQEPNTLAALERIRESKIMPAKDAERLIDNYRGLRRIEGILRRWSFAGETLLPDDPAPLDRVALRCAFPDAQSFMRAVGQYRKTIRDVYDTQFPT